MSRVPPSSAVEHLLRVASDGSRPSSKVLAQLRHSLAAATALHPEGLALAKMLTGAENLDITGDSPWVP